MGIQVKHVVVVASVFSVVGFGYVVGFGDIDVVRSPRAGALGRQAGVGQMVGNIRGSMVAGRGREAMRVGDELVFRYPQDARAHLNRGYAYRMMGLDTQEDGFEGWGMLRAIVGQRSMLSLSGNALGNALYLRGWALRGVGLIDESRADFLQLALMTEQGIGVAEGEALAGSGEIGRGSAYNLACYWALAGDYERAIGYWRVCVEGGYDLNTGGGWWRVDPDFEDLWEDERFWTIGTPTPTPTPQSAPQSAPQYEEGDGEGG